MRITLSPQVRNDTLVVSKSGDILIINGTAYDFSTIPDGASLPAEATDCEYIVGEIERIDGALILMLLLPISAGASEAARFPAPIISPADGALELPQ